MIRLRGGLMLLFMIAALSCPAQEGGGLPDSISTSENNVPPSSAITADSLPENGTRDSLGSAADTPSLRVVSYSSVNRYQRDPDFAYANDPAYWRRRPPPSSADNCFLLFLARFFGSKGFKYFLYLFLGVVLFYAIYKIARDNNLHIFYRPPRKQPGAGTEAEVDPLEEDLDKKIAAALQAGDHRLGTRYLFLKALRLLNERELIRYQARATNHEYMLQMASHPQAAPFRFLAGAYEHVWYGDFALNAQQFDRLLHYFQDFYKTINSSTT